MRKNNDLNSIKRIIHKFSLEAIFSEDLYDLISIHEYTEKEQIIWDGRCVDALLLLFEGQAQIMPSSKEGRLVSMGFITPVDIIGDLEYFSKDSYYHSVYALTKCSVLVLPVKYIDSHFNKNIEFYKFICENLAHKMKKTSLLFSRSLLYPVKARIALYLLDLSTFNNTLSLSFSFKQTAELMGITPRHFRRLLSEFESQEILERKDHGVQIINKPLLKLECDKFL